ncbi:type IV toxin-antitoxin system AbiEi family antitoxin [Pseudonocardia adelaidensis]|uniref:AbiEi antitoxin of type IV toxin-antitoxin system n=1 Tax=Pseudonocardia adelaidensis TaxID=648754 RepID=A0ABP9NKQ5_9PSEU
MALELLLARQAGVISREQALRAGLDAATVDRMVRTRRWQPLHPRVYLVRGYAAGDEARARAAVLWAGAGAALSGAAAAWWHGLLAAPPRTLAVTAPARRPARPGVVVRCRVLAPVDRTVRRGLEITAPALTAVEAAAELAGVAGEQLLERALAGRVRWPDVLAAHRRNPAAGAGAVLAAAADARLVGLLRATGWRGWRLMPGRPATVVFPAARVAVEAVGWVRPAGTRTHPGWRVLRVERGEIAGRPGVALAAIAAAVGRDLHHLDARIEPSTGRSR